MKQINTYSYWIIIIMLLFATSMSFLDRQVLSVSILKIREELNITDIDYGFINVGFLISYAIMFTLGGILIDRFGSRLGLAFSVGFWSFATILHSLSTSVIHFELFRFMLGMGEGGCFPGAIKAVIEWVPKSKHSLANGIAIGGSAAGAVLAPPLCVYLLCFIGWRALFLVTGGFGFLWLFAWLIITSPGKKSLVTNVSENKRVTDYEKINLAALIKNKEVKVFLAIRFLLDPIFYFYMFWIPKYLSHVHSLSIEVIGNILWIPFLALGIGNIFGGWLSDFIFRKTWNLNLARKLVMGVAAILTIPVVAIGIIHSYIIIIVLMTLAFFAHGLWITNYITSISDLFGKHVTSTVVGLSGSAGAISSLALNPVIGYIVINYSYNSLWWYSGVMYPLAFLLLLKYIPQIKMLNSTLFKFSQAID